MMVSAEARDSIDGYLGGETYPTGFHKQFAPAWIDAMLRQRGLVPPRVAEGAPFQLLDLGCGDGLALVALAAAHPEGRFVGVDALAEHVQRGTAAAAYAGLTNVAFFHARFADMDDPIEPAFDYITAQGVLAWMSAENRAHVRRLCGRYLKPGGISCIGYNTMPGWSHGLAVQQMLNLFAEAQQGSAVERFAAALAQVRAIAEAGAPADVARFLAWLDGIAGTLPARYFPHEYLNRHWQPLWSGQEHAALAEHGLTYAGSSRAELVRPEFALSQSQRDALARIHAGPARETALDVMLDQTFRIDLFGTDLRHTEDADGERMAGWWAAVTGAAEADFALVSPAITVRFDTPAARALLAGLADGPKRLGDIAAQSGLPAGELLHAVDALWASGQALPCDPPAHRPHAGRFNQLNAAAAKAGTPLQALIGRNGLMPIDHAMIVAADGGDAAACTALARLGILEATTAAN